MKVLTLSNYLAFRQLRRALHRRILDLRMDVETGIRAKLIWLIPETVDDGGMFASLWQAVVITCNI
jgi:hypothetical protein